MYALQFFKDLHGTVDGRFVVKFGSDVGSIDSKHDLAVCTPYYFLGVLNPLGISAADILCAL